MGVVEDLPADAPQPRLCHLVKRTDFSGYGFNLHAEKAKPGQFIGAIDPDSPADHAGLKEGDRIVEVNGVNINQENHKQVVERIKSIDNETRLLVVSKAAEDVYKRFGVVVKGTLPTVQHTSSLDTAKKHKVSSSSRNDDDVMDFKEQTASSAPPPIPSSPLPDDDGDSADRNSVGTPSNDQKSTTASESGSVSPGRSFSPNSIEIERKDQLRDLRKSYHAGDNVSQTSAVVAEKNRRVTSGDWGGLNLNMTAQEMRELIGSKKKRDPRREEKLDFHKKYEIIQTL